MIGRFQKIVIATSVLMVLANSARAQESPMEKARADFLTFCAACHGSSGGGDGPVASELVTQPPSLNQIAKRRAGVFDAAQVHRLIDGREMPRAHGTPEMPVWGNVFEFQATAEGVLQEDIAGIEKSTRQRIERLVKYLESIQDR
jgi:mono/diheme cytochrome c family protein